MKMNRRCFSALTTLLAGGAFVAAGLLATAARGQDTRLALTIFQGELSGLSLGSWGSGNIEPAREAAISGRTGLKVTTHGLYQGGRIDLQQPMDLSNAFKNPNAYMRFQIRFMKSSTPGGFGDPSGGFSGPPGGFSGPPSGFSGPPGGFSGPPGGFRGEEDGSGFGGGFGGGTTNYAVPFRSMRFLLIMADGTQHEMVRPVELAPADPTNGYAPLSFPLFALTKKLGDKVPVGDGAKLKSIAIFGDRFQQFYIGEINIISDETDITVQPLDDQIFFAQQTTVFVGNADAGATTLKYSWDFDASDGIQEDAVGRVVTHVFPRSGKGSKEYTITLTVSDVDGQKKPVRVTLKAEVSD